MPNHTGDPGHVPSGDLTGRSAATGEKATSSTGPTTTTARPSDREPRSRTTRPPTPGGAATEGSSSTRGRAGDSGGHKSTVREQVSKAGSEVASEVKERAAGLAQKARSGVERLAEEQRQRTSERLSSTAQSLRNVSDRFESEDPWLRQTSQLAAERIDKLAHHLEDRDVRDLLGEAEDLARERPTLFLGSMFVAGTVLGRFLRSSPEHRREAWTSEEEIDFGSPSLGRSATNPSTTTPSTTNPSTTTPPTTNPPTGIDTGGAGLP